jgi:hypothetical protein
MRSFFDGWRRVWSAPALVAGVFVLTFALALPLTVAMGGLLASHLGESLAAERAAAGVNDDWWQEFTSQASGLGTTFTPAVIGAATTLDSISSVLDGRGQVFHVAGAIGVYLAAWTFLLGGILDRYARQRPTRTSGFFAACGVHFFRLLRLGVVAGAVYWWLFAYVHRWLFSTWYVNRTSDLDVERLAFVWRLGLYAAFGATLVLVNLLFDYAKIRIVVEDRRSALGALMGSARFLWRRLGRVVLLYALNAAVFIVLLIVWALIAPGAEGAGVSLWLGLTLSQLYILARLVLKLQFLASETSLFQSSLAHATYAAVPEPVWPDSPSADLVASSSSSSRA